MSLLSVDQQQSAWKDLTQPFFGTSKELDQQSPEVLAYNSLFEDSEDRDTPELNIESSRKDPLLLGSCSQEEQVLHKFESNMYTASDSHQWSIDDILAECTPEKSSLWTGALSEEEKPVGDLSSSSFTSPSNYSKFHSGSDAAIGQEYGAAFNNDLSTAVHREAAHRYEFDDKVSPSSMLNNRGHSSYQKLETSANSGSLQSQAKLFVKPTKKPSTGKIQKQTAKKPRAKRSSKFNHSAKRASLEKLVAELQSKNESRSDGTMGFLIRKSISKELKIEGSCVVPTLRFGGTMFGQVLQYLDDQCVQFEPAGQFRTIWNYHRIEDGPTITLCLTPYDGVATCDGNNYQFSVISRLLPHDCFGNPQSANKKKANRIQDELDREKRADHGKMFRWRHLLTSFEYFKLVSFMLGTTYDYSLNDNQLGETRGSDGKVISPEKRHDMRTRSHAKIYFEGKAVKSAHELLNAETADRRKSFIVGTFGQIMGYTHMRPFGSDSSLSVMEFKYLEEALSKEINFQVFHAIE
ncbi:LADA_0E09868g1_1 [Lachancea dasiensis]|uniref:LADA_0E09868g1_1 n=1 Tax=Lachancea dasiensis TaxID=1072105 RepID=A0A1G4JE68_9SACH|nr:LADA_0E09868g1_1 [Lachancea dasiensis]